MSELQALLRRLSGALERSQVPFMIVGSFASAAHGLPRATQDVDIVIDPPNRAALVALLAEFPSEAYYSDSDAAHDAFSRRSMFNVVDLATGWKIDFILRKDRPFSREEFNRRIELPVLEISMHVASPEDTIIAKLEWSRLSGGSERQRRDIRGILVATGEALDRVYVEHWVNALGLNAEWEEARRISPTQR